MAKTSNASPLYCGPIPWLTFAVAAIAVLVQTDVSISQYLAYDRVAIQAGEGWRLLTGHLVHWSGNHLLWDVVMFATLGAIVESRDRAGFIVTLVGSAIAISAVLWLGHPAIDQYRGLSGIDSALFMNAAASLTIDARRAERPILRGLISLFVLGFAAKIAYELFTGSALFVDSAAAGFRALPSVHMIGGIFGGLSAWMMRCRFPDQ